MTSPASFMLMVYESFQRSVLWFERHKKLNEYLSNKSLKILLADVTTDAVGVAIAAPPSEGEANAELCRYLSKVLEVKKSEVVLEKVFHSLSF